ncbi:MAG: hypothetical protein GWO02_16185 [Gammaproteobacteria bacterium]|nr:hypothetical protein [Gammaproteobacteria bacterium]
MAGHFPFAGKRGIRYGLSPRMSITAFFESHRFGLELQEKYYRWWYDWAQERVRNDPDLAAAKGTSFNGFPYGQHAEHGFHLNEKQWAAAMADLGDLIRDSILPKLSDQQLRELEARHGKLVEQLEREADEHPRRPAPEIGYFKHV